MFRAKEQVMLVLSRKTAEKIVIGDNIVVTVIRVAGGRVQLGIEAPREMSIKRSELKNRTPHLSAMTSSELASPWRSASEEIAFNYQ
jgi:carbon storage regulator